MLMLIRESCVIKYWQLRPKGRTVPDPILYHMHNTETGKYQRKDQCCTYLAALSSGAEITVDETVFLSPFL